MTKDELRKKYKILRKKFDEKTIDGLSRASFSLLFNNFELNAKNVGIFLPIPNKNEPNTFLLLTEFFSDSINYFAPKIDTVLDQMNFYSIRQMNQIEFGLYRIPEPISIRKIEFSQLDILLIPLLCFDFEGNRVGYGKGYYDRLLKNAPNKLLKIGISLFHEPEQIDDINAMDVALDYCITPHKLYKFGKIQ
ncbi:MAG: 5-formyltetrahydrofolate cyclo-ligase [Bacteroidetes bacterium]|nr:5-formyltetrahydrofolate cyclo-ligase [Bacteroidota bacterium]